MRGWITPSFTLLVASLAALSAVAVSCGFPQFGGFGATGGSGGATTSTASTSATATGGKGGTGGTTSSSATSTSSSTGGTGGTGGSANPCEGVPCDTPPANQCNGSNLVIYASVGTCDSGSCTYNTTTQPCANGCANGMCNGDPCAGVSCNNPPAPTCLDATILEVPQAPGACSGGNCTYPKNQVNCTFGCANDQCVNDPCAGVMCTQPAASYCVDASHLRVRDLPGMCSAGSCNYTTHDEFCSFGCVNGACSGDPCIGVTCPPKANYCSDASTLVQYDAGMCVNGLPCTYGSTNVPCPNGCVNGQCVQCTVSSQCSAGNWCNNNVCVSCNSDLHCGASCAVCSGGTPKCNGTTCVACLTNGNCAAGSYCDASNTCQPCTTTQFCGPSCVACSGMTPVCGGSGCVQCNTSADCSAGNYCNASTCQACTVDLHCGPSCAACGGGTPKCNGTTCVQCLVDGDCTSGNVCGPSKTCIPAGCAPPTAACTSSGNQDGGCANALVISRIEAGSAAGFEEPNDYGLCNRTNNFTDNTCGGGSGSDAEYKLYMRKNEVAAITLTRGSATCTSSWAGSLSLKIFEAACDMSCTCSKTTCPTQVYCTQGNSQSPMFTAPADGWYTIVVDSAGTGGDVGGVYDLKVKLTCMGGNCACN